MHLLNNSKKANANNVIFQWDYSSENEILLKVIPNHPFLLGLALNKAKNKNREFAMELLHLTDEYPDTKFEDGVYKGLNIDKLLVEV